MKKLVSVFFGVMLAVFAISELAEKTEYRAG